jgi:hypothetical protein
LGRTKLILTSCRHHLVDITPTADQLDRHRICDFVDRKEHAIIADAQSKEAKAAFQRPDVEVTTCRARGKLLDTGDNLPAAGGRQPV